MEEQGTPHRLRLEVSAAHVHLFTTVLQSGIEIKTESGNDIGTFLQRLEVFTMEYLSQTVETIFLNGTPIDELSHPLEGKNPTLALSAAMPGLAGAIFRKNSYHTALRTSTGENTTEGISSGTTTVTLKLFNTIAKERGQELLHRGVTISGLKFTKFIERNGHLIDYILTAHLNDVQINLSNLVTALHRSSTIYLIIRNKDD